MFDLAPPPRIWLPPKPAIIRAHEPRDIRPIWKATFPFPVLGGRAVSPTTAYTAALNADDGPGNDGYSFRSVCGSLAAGGRFIRVTWTSASGGAEHLKADNCGVGIRSSNADTTATPSELKFSGASGFDIAAGAVTKVSDWLYFLFTTSDTLIVIHDFASSGGGSHRKLAGAGTNSYFKAATDSYDTAAVSGFTASANFYGVSLIEAGN